MIKELKTELETKHPCFGCDHLTYEKIEMSFASDAPYIITDVWIPICFDDSIRTIAIQKCEHYSETED